MCILLKPGYIDSPLNYEFENLRFFVDYKSLNVGLALSDLEVTMFDMGVKHVQLSEFALNLVETRDILQMPLFLNGFVVLNVGVVTKHIIRTGQLLNPYKRNSEK